ncbi:peptidoglycan-associated lipoprotein [Robiginitomaculum antarcticum]|uniref:peptidoglycan-associated lipoprotein n=1 Tax=Robiginitomaculum antarcticum TaxID=437507 RepID=UPI00036EAF9E|nr:OmpA family protein [Robiginitomaculum antarcticum]
MSLKKLSIVTLAGVAMTLGACATKPKEKIQTVQRPVQSEAPRSTAPPIMETGPMQETQIAPPLMQGPIPGSIQDFVERAGDRVFFGYDQDTLSPQAMQVLRAQASWLQNYPGAVIIIGGHADERGTREYNLALGARRAEAVKSFLVGQSIAPNRMSTVSYGKERPIDGRSTEEAWALNRNGHTAIVSGTNS